MEQLPLSFYELLEVVGYFSALTIVIGVLFQALVILGRDRRLSAKFFKAILVTQLLVFIATIWLWLKWPMGIKILYGPILFPALASEILIIPLVLGFFGYGIFRRQKQDP
jgi:hypothetical protein